MVNEQNKLIYGSDETKKQYEECKSVLTKNKTTNDLANVLLKDPVLLSHASDYTKFANELFVTIIDSASLKLLEAEKAKIAAEQAKLEAMKSSLDDSDNALSKIWSNFESRFMFDKFDLKIRNRFDAVIGFEVPHFTKCIKGTNTEIIDPTELRFSTGEIRTFNLINAIIDIERARLSNQEVTIVLDDAVDSFDYKNKYGIIDYLVELKDDPNIQIIIFTHNFDFYRSMILAFGKGNTEQFFMYKNQSNDEIKMYSTKNKGYYLQVVEFNSWKKCANSVTKYFAYIPFARNIVQLRTNSSHQDVKDIDSYFHYDCSTSESKDFTLLNSAVSSHITFNFPSSYISLIDRYLKKLDETVSNILSSQVNETDLDIKITLGLYIRLFIERFLSRRFFDSTGNQPVVSNPMNSFRELFSQVEPFLNESEKLFVIEANIIAPSYVHANSFMYEPLIDVGSDSLIKVADKLKTLNSTWPL